MKYFGDFLSLEQCLQWCRGGILIYVPIMLEDLLKGRDIANFQGGESSFAPIYLKISVKVGEIFWASFNPWNNVYQCCRGEFLINVPIM